MKEKELNGPNPRLKANSLSRLVFWWLKPLFSYGNTHDLETKDIYNVLPKDESEQLGNNLEKNWKLELTNAAQENRPPKLFNALKKTFVWSFFYYGGWIMVLSVFLRVWQPFCLGLLIQQFQPESDSNTKDTYVYASIVILMTISIALIAHHSNLGLMEVGMRVRIASSSLIYRKILRLSKSPNNSTTSGQVINLLSNDVARFDMVFTTLHYIWIMPIQGALIAFLIWRSVGIASLAGLILITLQTIPIQGYIGKLTSQLRLKIALKTDQRVCLMSEIISGIQVIKMYTWEKPFQELVNLSRSLEIDVLTSMSYLRGFTLASFVFTERTTLFFTVMAYALNGNDITADKVFSMAQYFNILQLTMAIFYPMAVAASAEAFVSINRLQDFLLLDENIKSNHILPNDEKKSIFVKNVTASWSQDSIINTLHEIKINIKSGQLYAVVGPVGAGKSSLLQLILGELIPSRGKVLINGKISYASQESWLFSGTVKDNILFGETYEETKYQSVIRVCDLSQDLQQFLHGDKTYIGDKGAGLSGGQRARINLARAIYRDSDIYILDDPLSAVDTQVGKHLFEQCIKGYLKDKTRILVTHQVQYLRNCDYIIMLNNGRIEIQGSFDDFQKKQIDFLNISSMEDSKEGTPDIVEPEGNINLDGPGTDHQNDIAEPKETEELMAKGKLKKSIYRKYIRSGASVFMIIAFLCSMILGQFGSSGCDYWVAYWTKQGEIRQRVRSHTLDLNANSSNLTKFLSNLANESFNENTTMKDENDHFQYMSNDLALWIYGIFIVMSITMTTTRNIIFYKICMNASKRLHNLMFSSLLQAPMLFFDKNPSGRILNRFSKDVGAVDERLPQTMIEAIQIFCVGFGILSQVIIIKWWTIFLMIFVGYLYWRIRTIYISTAQNIKRLEGITKSPVFSHVNSTLSGLTTIRSSNAQEMVRKEFDIHQDLHTSTYFLLIATSTAFGFALDVVSICFISLITYGLITLDDGTTFAGDVGLAITQVLILCGMLQHGMRQTTEAMTQMTSVERILQFTELDKEGPFQSEPKNKPPIDWPSKGDVKFDHVNLRYTSIESPTLKDLTFHIEPAMKIGIVGRTGAGKSSLISALFNMCKLDGAIYIDGIDTKSLGLYDLRNKISIIPQEPILFSATLRNNLDPFNKYDDFTIWAALEGVELKNSVSSLDHFVNQGGSNFSIGQRQLICLARAILKNNKILVLDEATANVDPTTDSLIQTTIRNKFKECTVLTIAHRLNTIMDSDKVIVMDQGRCVEFDHPFILLKNENGYFAKMVKETGKNMAEKLSKISKEAYDSINVKNT